MKNIEQIIKGISENGVTGFAVFEDNGGGLNLGIWYDDGQDEESFEENFFCHYGYEYNVGQLMDDLTALSEEQLSFGLGKYERNEPGRMARNGQHRVRRKNRFGYGWPD